MKPQTNKMSNIYLLIIFIINQIMTSENKKKFTKDGITKKRNQSTKRELGVGGGWGYNHPPILHQILAIWKARQYI